MKNKKQRCRIATTASPSRSNDGKRGFTFMEMVITMLIIITLSLLSYPLYTGVAGREQSKLAEGYALLGYIVNAEVAYYNQYGYFYGRPSVDYAYYCGQTAAFHLAATPIDEVLGINAINNRYFSAFSFPCGCPGKPNLNKYEFAGFVFSSSAGTIKLRYSTTARYEPEVIGV